MRNDRGPKILVVDDDPIALEIMTNILRREGYTVKFVRSGRMALRTVAIELPDLILLDVKMPDMDGYKVCRCLKSDESSRSIPVIFISVLDEAADKVEAFNVGGIDYITKPFQTEEILARVKTHLDLRRLQKQLEMQNIQLQQEITERKRAEEALRESEAISRALINAPTDSVLLLDTRGVILDLNKIAEERLGKGRDELVGTYADKSLPEDIAKRRRSRISKIFETGREVRFEDERDAIWYDTVAYPIPDKDGAVSRIAIIARDITDRKQAEEALWESKHQYDTLAANIPVGVYLLCTTPTGGFSFKYVSPQMAKIFGLSTESILADPQIVFQPIHPEESETFVRLNRESIETRQPFLWEGRVVVKGTLKWLRIESQPEVLDNDDVLWHGVVADITERKRVEESLRESRRQFADIIDFLPDATFVIDKKGKAIAWNRAIEDMTGISAAEMIGKDNFEYAAPFYGNRLPILANQVINPQDVMENRYSSFQREKDILKGEIAVPFLKGEERILSSRAAPIYNNEGEIVGAIESLRDITEQKLMEKALSSEHLKLSSILDGSPISSFVIDSEHRVTAWNMVNEFFTGISKEDVLGKPLDLSLLFKDKASPILAALVLEMTDEEIIRHYAHKGIRKSNIHPEAFESTSSIWIKGKEHIMAIQATRLRDAAGNVIGAIQCAEDITEQRRAEEALRESEELYRTALESSNDGVVIYQDGRYVYLNRKFLDTLGRSREEMMGKAMGAYIHPDDLITVLDYYDKYQKGLPVPNNFEVRVSKPDGAIIHAEISPVEVTFKGNKSLMAYVRNITDRKRAEEEYLKVHKLESVGTLAGGIAHDFNNLLTVIQGYIELIKMDVPPGDKVYNRLMAAEKSVNQAMELTNRLIIFAKGGEPIKKVSDISNIVKDAVLRSIGALPVEKRFHLDSNLWSAEVDEGQIRQVIKNLSINALEAMPEGGILTIRAENTMVRTQDRLPLSKGAYIIISIEDTGIGIPTDELPFIFDPYFSTKKRGAEKGMGLGLSVCHSVVSKHNGCITVESKEGKGSTFHVYLPAAVSKELLIKEQPPDERTGAKGRILVMDDEAMVRDMLTEVLMAMGYDVETAKDGLSAIDLYIKAGESQRPYKMVILDLTIPGGLGGKQTMERLLTVDPDVKGVILSGYTDNPVIQNYAQYGFVGALKKPFKLKALQDILEKICK